MGLEVIWTGFAYNLFESRINSITNDLRAYTINLFHHWIVYRIRSKRVPDWWKPASRNRFHGGDKAAFSRALLVLLEKILLLSFCKTERAFDELGLTGLSNARNVYARVGKSYRYTLDDTPNKETDLLARHAQLGFSGRYRTSFTRKLHLLEKATGHPVDLPDRWHDIQNNFNQYKDFRELAVALEATLIKVLKRGQDEFWAGSLEGDLEALYISAFGSKRILESRFGPFWYGALAFHQGPTRWLWDSLCHEPPEHEPTPQHLYQQALDIGEKAGDIDGTNRIRHVCEVEPYLARCSRIFDSFLRVEHQTFQQVVAWVVSRYGNNPLMAVAPPDPSALISALEGEGEKRLRILLEMQALEASALVDKLLEYHKVVSDYRHSGPWVQEEGGVWRQRHFLPTPEGEEGAAGPEPWLHPYYGGPFLNLAQAIRRGMTP